MMLVLFDNSKKLILKKFTNYLLMKFTAWAIQTPMSSPKGV